MKDSVDGVRTWLGWGVETVLGFSSGGVVTLILADRGGFPHRTRGSSRRDPGRWEGLLAEGNRRASRSKGLLQ